GHWWDYFVCSLMYFLAIAVGYLLLIIPGIYLGTVYILAPCESVLGRRRAGRALKRSQELIRPNFWRVLALLVILAAAGLVVLIPMMFLRYIHIGLADAWFSLLILVGVPFGLTVNICLYRNLQRCEKQRQKEEKRKSREEPVETQAQKEDRQRRHASWCCLILLVLLGLFLWFISPFSPFMK
ncbi:MAG: hypothetical protein KGZ25_03345, partial [Planctomycetes bacterium]|nr:hypothetical protein [Planctomycetota bacterium]